MATTAAVASLGPSEASPSPAIEMLIVDQEQAKELICCICLQLLDKPRQCRNGHLFCLSCILQSIEKHSVCPQCRCELQEESLARSLFVEKHIRTLKLHCKYHFAYSLDEREFFVDPEGCPAIVTLESRSAHESMCGYAFVPCRYNPNACSRLRRRDEEVHKDTCPYRPVQCQHCQVPTQFCQLNKHLEECPMQPIRCEHCGEPVSRGRMAAHRKSECPEESVPCDFAEQGCNAVILRKELEKHLEENRASHMILLKRAFDDQNTNMKRAFEMMMKSFEEQLGAIKREYEELLRNKEDKLAASERQARDSNETKVHWKLANFSTLRKKSYLQSEKFKFAGFTWFLGFYTNGDNEESRGYYSIYLFLDVATIPKGKAVTVEYLLKFVNQRDPAESVRKEFKTTFPIKGGQGWGDRKAVRASRVTAENGFLKDDVLIVEADLTLKKTLWSV